MLLIEEILKTLKPKSFLKLGEIESYLDKVIDVKPKEGTESYDLILIDCKKDYDTFKTLYELALKSLTSKGVIIVNGGMPRFSAYQTEKRCGKLWYYILTSGKKTLYYNDEKLGLSIIKNKDQKVIDGASPDFTWFYFNVKSSEVKDIKAFVKPTVKKKKVDEVL